MTREISEMEKEELEDLCRNQRETLNRLQLAHNTLLDTIHQMRQSSLRVIEEELKRIGKTARGLV